MKLIKLLVFILLGFTTQSIYCSELNQNNQERLKKLKPHFYVYGMDIQRRQDVSLSEKKIKEINYRLSAENVTLESSEYLVKLFLSENKNDHTGNGSKRILFWIPSNLVFDEKGNVKEDFSIRIKGYGSVGDLSWSCKDNIGSIYHFRVLKLRSKL